jgi:hypothetical protein
VPFKVLHHFHDVYVTSISHVNFFFFIHHLTVIPSTIPSITSLSWCVCNLSSCFNKTFIHHTYNRKCHSKDYITFYDVDVHLSFMFKKKSLFIHHPTKCHSKVLHHFQNVDVIYLSMVLKTQFIHHLTKCHSKVLHHFENVDVIYYPCF